MRHVDPSHFETSKQSDFRAFDSEAYKQRKEAAPLAPREVRHVDASHFQTSKQAAYRAYDVNAVRRTVIRPICEPATLDNF